MVESLPEGESWATPFSRVAAPSGRLASPLLMVATIPGSSCCNSRCKRSHTDNEIKLPRIRFSKARSARLGMPGGRRVGCKRLRSAALPRIFPYDQILLVVGIDVTHTRTPPSCFAERSRQADPGAEILRVVLVERSMVARISQTPADRAHNVNRHRRVSYAVGIERQTRVTGKCLAGIPRKA